MSSEAPRFPGTFISVPIEDVVFSKTNPRKHVDQEKLKELADSVKEKGILVPPLVRLAGKKYEVVAGERRIRAAKMAALESVPVIVRELTDEQALEVQVIENLQREDIHPLEEAAGFQQLMDNGKHTPKTIAEKVGKTTAWVYQTLKLNDLIPEAKKIYWEGRMNRTVALRLARVPQETQKDLFKEEMKQYPKGHIFTVDNIDRDMMERMIPLASAPFKHDAEGLHPKAPACNQCPFRSSSTPELFPDVKKKEMCLKPECFAVKCETFAQLRADALQEEGIPFLFIADTYYPNLKCSAFKGENVLERGDYNEVSPKEKKSKIGLVVASDHVSHIGRTLSIVPHAKTSSSTSSGKSNRPSADDLFKRKIANESSRRVMLAIMEKSAATPMLPHRALAHAVDNLIGTHWMSQSQVDHYQKCLSLDGKVNGQKLKSIIFNAKTTDHDLHRILTAALLARESQDELATIFKVDAGKIRQETKQQMEAARKEREKEKSAKNGGAKPKKAVPANGVGTPKKGAKAKKSLALPEPEDQEEGDDE